MGWWGKANLSWRIAAALASGLLYSCCFPPLSWWPLGLVALLPLLLALEVSGVAAGALLGLLAGASGTLATVPWLALPLVHAYGFPWPIAVAFLAGIALYVGVFYALIGATHALLARRTTPLPLLWIPALWVAAELARARLGVGVPWLFVGHTQAEVLPMVQIADLTGLYGVSFLVVAGNAALLGLLTRRRWSGLAVVAAGVACVLGYGVWRISSLEGGAGAGSPETLRLAIVQPAIPQEQKWDRAFFVQGMRRLYALTREAVQPASGAAPELVLWPETALTVDLEGAAQTLAPVVELLRPSGASLLLGAPRLPPAGAAAHEVRNSAALLGPDGVVSAAYDKQILLPFGEYYPDWLQRIAGLKRELTQHMGDVEFSPGPGPTLLTIRGIPFGVAICYEATYPGLVAELVRRGARFVVNLTNDAWFEHSAGAAQHLAMARLRAVEHRVPLVRAANTGISAIVAPSGRIVSALAVDVQGLLRGELVFPPAAQAPYTRWGDRFAGGCVLLLPTLLVAGLLRRRFDFLRRRDP